MVRRSPAFSVQALASEQVICRTPDNAGEALKARKEHPPLITINYDTLFEQASKAAGQAVDVLPYEPARGGHRWLQKLHGCATRPEDRRRPLRKRSSATRSS